MADYESSRGLPVPPAELGAPVCRTVPEVVAAVRAAGAAARRRPLSGCARAVLPGRGRRRRRPGDRHRVPSPRAGEAGDVEPCAGRRPATAADPHRRIAGQRHHDVGPVAARATRPLPPRRVDHLSALVRRRRAGRAARRPAGPAGTAARRDHVDPGAAHARSRGSGGRWPLDPRRRLPPLRGSPTSGRAASATARFDNTVDFGGYSAFYAQAAVRRGRPGALHLAAQRHRHRDAQPRPQRLAAREPASHQLALPRIGLPRLGLARAGRAERPAHRPPRPAQRVRVRPEHGRRRAHPRHGRAAASRASSTARSTAAPEVGTRTFVTVGTAVRAEEPPAAARRLRASARRVHRHPVADHRRRADGPAAAPATRRARLGAAVTFAGAQANPFALLARSDCFVLTSDYEGQPMVLLEALVVGLPVVTTDFESVSDALPGGAALVVRRDADAVADGLRAYLRGELSGKPFDVDALQRRGGGRVLPRHRRRLPSRRSAARLRRSPPGRHRAPAGRCAGCCRRRRPR